LDVSKQHVLGTMHQSYNAESPKFVNESRRRESDTARRYSAIQGFAAIQYNHNINNWTLTIDNPPDGHSNTFTKVTDVFKTDTFSMNAEKAEIWLEDTVKSGTMNTGIENTIKKMYKSTDSESGEWITYPRDSEIGGVGYAYKIEWTQSAEARIIHYPSFQIVKEVVEQYFSLIKYKEAQEYSEELRVHRHRGTKSTPRRPKKVFVDKEAPEYTEELNMGVQKLLLDLLPKNSEFKDKYCSNWQRQRGTFHWNHRDVVKDIITTIEEWIAPNRPDGSRGYEFLQRNTTVH